MRETEMLVDNTLPQATEVKKLERKSLVSYIYIGSPRGLNRKKFGTKAKIQLNDAYSTVREIQSFIAAERESRAEEEIPLLTTSIKADVDVKMGIVSDIKEELRKAQATKSTIQLEKNSINLMVKIGDLEIGEFPLLLAPMEDVSDPPFRKLCKKGGADLMYTEFISSEGLIRNAYKSVQKLDIFEFERPIGIQIFGNNIESMKEATEIATSVNPDIIDINYGCPVKKVTCKGGGAAILQDIPKMVKMTAEIVKSTNIPVTVKTRLGWDEKTKFIVEVSERLQDVGIKAISIHGRTRKQMYKGEANWELIREVKITKE